MILSIIKTIREKLPFIWNLIEWVNGEVISILYLKKIKKTTEKVLNLVISDYEYRVLREDDLSALCLMLSMQPKNFDIFFKPHDFDIESLRKVFKNKAFLMFGVFDKDKIIGYFFIRFFANRKAFRGKMVDVNFQGRFRYLFPSIPGAWILYCWTRMTRSWVIRWGTGTAGRTAWKTRLER